jgi:hypothetical protein
MQLKLAQWASDPPVDYPGAIEPPAGKTEEGWDNGEEPAAGHFNYVVQALADTQREVGSAITLTGGTLDASDLTQLWGALQRQQVKVALASLKLADDLGAGTLHSIARSPSGRTIAVGAAGLIATSGGDDGFATEAPIGAYAGDYNDIVYDAVHGLFIAGGTLSALHTSPGNGTWTSHVVAGAVVRRAVATDGAGNTVIVGNSASIWSSATGLSWASRTNPFADTPDIVGVAASPSAFVCVTDKGDIASSSNGGVSWTVRQALAGSVSGGGGPKVGYHSSLGFIYHWGANVYRSADGITWAQIHNAAVSSTETPGLLVTPYCWMIGRATGSTGTAIDGRFSPTASNAATDFRADYVVADGLVALKLVDGQLMGVAGSKIYVGGVL